MKKAAAQTHTRLQKRGWLMRKKLARIEEDRGAAIHVRVDTILRIAS